MKHSLHLAARHVVESIVPGLSKQHGTGSTDAKGVLVNDDGSNDDNEDDDIDAADSLGKAIALVKQVCISMEI